MAIISIPQAVRPGFLIISKMQDDDVDNFIDIINSIKIGEDLDNVEENLRKVFEKNARTLLQTTMSFVGLLDKDDNTPDSLSKDLSQSFNQLNEDELLKEDIVNLEKNLQKILLNVNALKKNINSHRSAFDNESTLKTSKLLTDVRILFDNEIKSDKRDAVILHRLNIEYYQDFADKEIYLTLDLKDLNKLKAEIEQAIEKDQIMREDYNKILNFIF